MSSTGQLTSGKYCAARSGRPPRDTTARTVSAGKEAAATKAAAAPVLAPNNPHGRPRKEGMDYFPHDVDASADEKIEAMRSVHGNDGYAFYFIILERIYRSNQAELDISKQVILTTLARKIMVTQNKLKKMIDTSVEIGLFCSENFEKRKILTSDGIKKRFLMINNLRDKWRENKGIEKSFLNGKPSGKPVENSGENAVENATKESKVKEIERKEKESKEKESKEKESKGEEKERHAERVFLTQSEHQVLLNRYGPEKMARLINELNLYKLANGKEYASDAGAIQSWVIKRIEEQDARQATAPRYQANTNRAPSQYQAGNKHIKPGMQVHVQDDDLPTQEEMRAMMEQARLMDELAAKRAEDRKRLEDSR
jgi:hypothetical protein